MHSSDTDTQIGHSLVVIYQATRVHQAALALARPFLASSSSLALKYSARCGELVATAACLVLLYHLRDEERDLHPPFSWLCLTAGQATLVTAHPLPLEPFQLLFVIPRQNSPAAFPSVAITHSSSVSLPTQRAQQSP